MKPVTIQYLHKGIARIKLNWQVAKKQYPIRSRLKSNSIDKNRAYRQLNLRILQSIWWLQDEDFF